MDEGKTDIENIILAGITAPSGDNLQPWHFRVQGNAILVFATQTTDSKKVIDYSAYVLYVTHGALIENMLIAARHFGYVPAVVLFPTRDDLSHTATITLHHGPVPDETDFYELLTERVTDRNAYLRQPLTEAQKKDFREEAHAIDKNAQVYFVEENNKIIELSHLVMTQISIIITNKKIHEEFFSALRWTIDAVRASQDGLDVETLELGWYKRLLFRSVLSSWNVMKTFRFIGLPALAARIESYRYRATGAYCAVTFSADTKEDFIAAGRILERLWLSATKHKLSFQPTFATEIIYDSVKNNPETYVDAERILLEKSVERIRATFRLKTTEEKPIIIFRVGVNTRKQPVRSLRKPPVIVFEQKTP